MILPEKLRHSALWWKALGILIAIGALLALGQVLPLKEWFADFNHWVDHRGIWGMAIYTGVYIVAVVLLVPGWILTVGAGLTFGIGWGLLISTAGATIASTITFIIARYTARDIVERYARRNRGFNAVDTAIASKGWKIIIFLRMSPAIPWNISNYVYGLTKISLPHYVIGTIIGMQPGNLLLLYLGAAGRLSLGGKREITTEQAIFLAIGLVVTVGVTVYVTRLTRRALRDCDDCNDPQ